MSYNPADWVARSREFVGEVQVEVKKVTWPTQKETVAGTIGVAAIVTVVSIALFGVDSLLGWIVARVLQ